MENKIPNIFFSPPKLEDAYEIEHIINKNYDYMKEYYTEKNERVTCGYIKKMLSDSNCFFYVMKLESDKIKDRTGKIIGVFSLIILEKQRAEISLITIDREFQGKHLSQHLITFAEIFAQKKGIKVIDLHVVEDLYGLIKWYEQLGYKKIKKIHWSKLETKERINEAHRDLHFWLMEKFT